MKKFFVLCCILSSLSALVDVNAQCTFDSETGTQVGLLGGDCNNTILTAVPFLRIAPDARVAGMGEAGLAISPDANSIAFNASRLAYAENNFEIAATYTPWLRELGVRDVYLAYLAGYTKLSENEALGFSLRYFSLGDVQFTDLNGMNLGEGNPNEFEVSLAYARKLSEKLSAGITGKFIYSNLASGQSVGGLEINAGTSGAVDLSLTYNSPVGQTNDLTVALAITNIGSKIGYIPTLTKDFIPTNLGIGTAYIARLSEFNKLTVALDINKLLVPSPYISTHPEYDVDPQDNIADHRQVGLFSGMLGSFGDAPNGFSEELQEFYYSLGLEYVYNERFAVRAGYFYEHRNKGNRKFLTAGVGLGLNEFQLDLSYLIPTSNQRSALDNTLRFTVMYKVTGATS